MESTSKNSDNYICYPDINSVYYAKGSLHIKFRKQCGQLSELWTETGKPYGAQHSHLFLTVLKS